MLSLRITIFTRERLISTPFSLYAKLRMKLQNIVCLGVRFSFLSLRINLNTNESFASWFIIWFTIENTCKNERRDIILAIAIFCWNIWKFRSQQNFENFCPPIAKLTLDSCRLITDSTHCLVESSDTTFWIPPNLGCFKINFDDSYIEENGKTGADFLIQNGDSLFLVAQVELGRRLLADTMKCMTTRFGLLKSHELGLKNVVLEGDCKEVIAYL